LPAAQHGSAGPVQLCAQLTAACRSLTACHARVERRRRRPTAARLGFAVAARRLPAPREPRMPMGATWTAGPQGNRGGIAKWADWAGLGWGGVRSQA